MPLFGLRGFWFFRCISVFWAWFFKNSLLSSPPSHFLPFSHFFLSFSTFGVSLFLSLNL